MSPADVVAVLLAGLSAGIVITAIGAGSLISFPILLAIGLPPVVANVSNTVGLVAGGLTGSWGYRSELRGQGVRVRQVAVMSGTGALGGACLLLVLPSDAFEAVVPGLILTASALIGVQPLISRWLRRLRREGKPNGLLAAPLLAICMVLGAYGGYFGAAQGVVLVAFLAIGLDEPMQHINGLKNIAVLSANVAGSLVFVFVAPIDWPVVGFLTIGSLLGGWVGAHIGRRLPAWAFRLLVVSMGLVVGFRLLLF